MEALEFIKSRTARRAFETLMKFKGRQFTINELSKEAGVPFSSLWRTIQRWESAGIIETSIAGRSRMVGLHESEYTKRISELLRLSVSPQALTADALKNEIKDKNVKSVYLFGSVAKKDEKLDSDIDLAILAGTDFNVNKLVFDIYEKYGTKIVPLIFGNKNELNRFLKDKEKVRII